MKRPIHQTTTPHSTLFLLIENRMLREVLADVFNNHEAFRVVGANRYGEEAFEQALASDFDVLVADRASASTFRNNFITDLLRMATGRKAVLFGMEDDPEVFLQAVHSGVSGYLLGETSAEDMVAAVAKVVAGEAVCPPKLCHHLFQYVAGSTRGGLMILNQRLCREVGLTARQQQLLGLLARGFTNKEIAGTLRLSEFTVKNHIHRIMRQLNAGSRHAAVEAVCDQNPAIAEY